MTEFESVTSTIALDFAQRTSPVTVFAKQGDENTRHITIQPLVNGVPMVIGRDEQFAARFAAKKPDGKYVYNDSASLREDNLIHVTLTDQTLAAHGNALCCIVLTNGEGKTLTSQNFTLIIEYSAGAYKNLASSDEILGLDAKLAQVQALLDQLGEEIRPLPPITEADKNKVLNITTTTTPQAYIECSLLISRSGFSLGIAATTGLIRTSLKPDAIEKITVPIKIHKNAICGKSLGSTAYNINPTNTINGVTFTVL